MDTCATANTGSSEAHGDIPTNRRLSLQYPLMIEHFHFLREKNPTITLDQALNDFIDNTHAGDPPYGRTIGDEIDRRYNQVMDNCDSRCGEGNCPKGIDYCVMSKNEVKTLLGLPIID